MRRTSVRHLLNIEYSIIQGIVRWLENAELEAAISTSGILGIIISVKQ